MISDYPRSRAILIGTANYQDKSFLPLPAAANSVTGVHEVLAEPDLCGWPKEQITVLNNPREMPRLVQNLRRLARETDGVLLFYFVGHGVILRRGQLCLVLSDTDAQDPDITGLEYQHVREALLDSPARLKIAILDCCHSGRAIEALSGGGIADTTDIKGVYTLTASDHTAHVPSLEKQESNPTSFTGELLDLIRTGIQAGPATLTFGAIYPALRLRLQAKGLPAPNQRGTDTANDFPFTANAASRNIRAKYGRAENLADEAILSAESVTKNYAKSTSLIAVAGELADFSPERAIRLADAALRSARSYADEIKNESGQFHYVQLLINVAEVLAKAKSDRAIQVISDAERVAWSLKEATWKASSLARISPAVAAVDPERAIYIINDAIRIASQDTSVVALNTVAEAQLEIVGVLVSRDLDQAENVARSVVRYMLRSLAIADVAEALTTVDMDRAERVARSTSDELTTDSALTKVACALASTNPQRAEAIARTLTSNYHKAEAFAFISRALFAEDPSKAASLIREAEALARSDSSESYLEGIALGHVSVALATTNPAKAEHLVRSLSDPGARDSALGNLASALTAVDPNRAELMARSISSEAGRERILGKVAMEVAATDPDRAERIARSITDSSAKAKALASVARILAFLG